MNEWNDPKNKPQMKASKSKVRAPEEKAPEPFGKKRKKKAKMAALFGKKKRVEEDEELPE